MHTKQEWGVNSAKISKSTRTKDEHEKKNPITLQTNIKNKVHDTSEALSAAQYYSVKKNSPATGIPCEVVPFSRGDTSQNILRNILCSEHLVEHKIQRTHTSRWHVALVCNTIILNSASEIGNPVALGRTQHQLSDCVWLLWVRALGYRVLPQYYIQLAQASRHANSLCLNIV